MAQLQDALWVARNFAKIQAWCGEGQVGGVSDPLSIVLAATPLGKLRRYQGLAAYQAFLDLQWGFDVAVCAGMLLNVRRAGVSGRDWLLLDDIMPQDKEVVELHGML